MNHTTSETDFKLKTGDKCSIISFSIKGSDPKGRISLPVVSEKKWFVVKKTSEKFISIVDEKVHSTLAGRISIEGRGYPYRADNVGVFSKQFDGSMQVILPEWVDSKPYIAEAKSLLIDELKQERESLLVQLKYTEQLIEAGHNAIKERIAN